MVGCKKGLNLKSDLLNLPTEIVVDCVNCKRNDSIRDSAFESWLALCPPYGVRKCKSCGLRWLSPRPTSAGYESVYSAENYFEAEAGEDIAYRNMIKTRCLHFNRAAGQGRLGALAGCGDGFRKTPSGR